jgi:hypothetical protein
VRQESTAAIQQSIEALKALLGKPEDPDGCRWTVERLSILGGVYRRLAWIDSEKRPGALNEMATAYRAAAILAAARECDTAYALIQTNWADVVRGWLGLPRGTDDLARDLGAARAELDAREADHRQFWYDSMRVECDLLDAVDSQALTEQRVQDIGDAYLRHRDYASAREFASVRDQLLFLADMAVVTGVAAEAEPTPHRRTTGGKGKARATAQQPASMASRLGLLLQKLEAERNAT